MRGVSVPIPGEVAKHLFVPGFEGKESVLLAVGILGATVMPHVVYLHSALTQHRVVGRDGPERRAIQRFERIDVMIAMGIAGVVNISMLAISAALLFGTGIASIPDAFDGFESAGGHQNGVALRDRPAGVGPLLDLGRDNGGSGGDAGVHQPPASRSSSAGAVTLAPALAVLAVGVDASRALVLSQVVLSFGIPFALVPLVIFTSRRDLMGSLTNERRTTYTAAAVAALIVGLNVYLLISILS